MKSIVITGDSWACGEWGNAGVSAWGISDQGVTGLFSKQGYNVVNLGCPGTDNWGLLQPLANFLWINTHLDIHRVYYFQTDIGRSFRHKSIPITECNHDLEKALEYMYTEVYQRLDEIAQQRTVNIHVIGGRTDVTVCLKAFNHLVLEVDSWCRLLDADLPSTSIADIASVEFLTTAFPQHKQQLLPVIERCLARTNFCEHSRYFFPDHHHPNLQGHRLLFERLEERL